MVVYALIDRIKQYIHSQEIEESGDIQYSFRRIRQNDFDEWLKEHSLNKTFREFILDLLQERDIESVTFYQAAGIDRKLFSRMKTEKDYRPSKETAVRCCLALKLDIPQTEHLLSLAGYSLSWSLHEDLAIRYCIQNGVFNVFDVFEVLDMLKQ